MSMSYTPQDSLGHRISSRQRLTEEEVDAIVAIVGYGCRQRTKGRLRWALKACPSIESYGIYSRVLLGEDGQAASYCAGQSYPDEIRTVKECLLKR